jgi:hypothetical protein
VEGVLLAAVQEVVVAQEVRQIIPDRTTCFHGIARPNSCRRTIWRTCVARKLDWSDLLPCRAFLQAGIRSGRRRSCSVATAAGHATVNGCGRCAWLRAILRRVAGP